MSKGLFLSALLGVEAIHHVEYVSLRLSCALQIEGEQCEPESRIVHEWRSN